MTELALYRAMGSLNGDQLYVINAIYWGGLNETQVANELTDLRRVTVNRDRVHRIRRTAEEKLRRALTPDYSAELGVAA